LAIVDGGEIHLLDPITGERSGWPPYWGEGAVSRTAVGFLDSEGRPVQRLDGSADELVAADAVGHVQGQPAEPNPAASQDEYRAQDRTTRRVDTRYAEPLGDIVDNLDQQQVRQLADDLSGVYGPYRVDMWRAEISRAGEVIIGGSIFKGDEEVGFVQRTFVRDRDGNLVVHDNSVDIDEPFRFKGFSKALTLELESYYEANGVDRIEMRTEQEGGHAWARRGFTWNPDPRKLQASLDSIKASAAELHERVSPEAQALLDEMVVRLEPGRSDLPEPIDLAALRTADEPDLGRQLLTDTYWYGVKYLRAAPTETPSPDIPLRLETVVALPEPVSELDLPDYPPGTLSEAEASTVYAHGEQRMRDLNEQFIRVGVSAEERARVLSELRNSLRAWTRDLMSNRATAEFLTANESNPTFDELVARNEERGLAGDAVFEAIVDSATHSRYTPGTLSDVETTSVYSDFELQLRDVNEQLMREGVGVQERARQLSELRSSLRAWTRELMSNRPAADWLAANESNPSFEDLIARNEAKGLTGDAVYEAIIDSATHSHYAMETLSNAETRTVYTTFELRMREVSERLLRDGAGLEERARALYSLRASIRTWTRALMADRETADYLTANEPNPTFEDLVERQRVKGRVGDEIYEAIIASATRSRASVNESLGIDPENPPDLPPMRGPADND
jgi:GNAT superfamily N-acetyltransferase